MTTFERNDVDDLNIVLTCTVPKSDFEGEVKSQLLRIQKNANIKGFRPGKAPAGIISKMYERGVIYEVVSKQIDKDFNDYLRNEALVYMGEPIGVEDNFNPTTLAKATDFFFKFEIGLVPTFELKGADKSFTATRYEIDVTDNMLDIEINALRERYGKRDSADIIDETSLIKANLVEINDDNTPKENGVTKEDTSFFINRMAESAKAAFINKAIADTIIIENIFETEPEMEAGRLKSWILGIEADVEVGNRFEVVITDIKSMQPANLDSAFFDMVFGEEGTVRSESELREHYKGIIKADYNNVASQFILSEVFKNITNVNKFDLPISFLRKFLKQNDPKLTDETLDKDWENIANDIRWDIIKSKVTAEEKIQITEQELINSFRNDVTRYFGSYANEQMIDTTVANFIKDEAMVNKRYREMLAERVLSAIANKINITTEILSREEFDQKMESKEVEQNMLEEVEA